MKIINIKEYKSGLIVPLKTETYKEFVDFRLFNLICLYSYWEKEQLIIPYKSLPTQVEIASIFKVSTKTIYRRYSAYIKKALLIKEKDRYIVNLSFFGEQIINIPDKNLTLEILKNGNPFIFKLITWNISYKDKHPLKSDIIMLYTNCQEGTSTSDWNNLKKAMSFLISVRELDESDFSKKGFSFKTFSRNSSGELLIEKLLKEANIDFKEQYSFKDCRYKGTLRFDFAIFKNGELSHLIEFNGAQHYFTNPDGMFYKTKEDLDKALYRDQIKKEYCLQHNIPLIIIPYYKQRSLTIKDLLTEE